MSESAELHELKEKAAWSPPTTPPSDDARGSTGDNPSVLSEPALVISGLTKTFGSRRAVDHVGFVVRAGEVHALIGGNGSGKSTLVKSLAGIQHADPGGTVQVGVETVAADQLSPSWARRHGLRFVHQNPGVFPTMTVADNVTMVHGIPSTGGLVRRRRLDRMTRELLDRFEVDVSPRARMGDLRLAEQTMVAIARALHSKDGEQISALILDEPTAALPEEEVHVLLDAIRHARRSGAGIVFISHRLEEVLAIADSVTVLRDGREVGTRPAAGSPRPTSCRASSARR